MGALRASVLLASGISPTLISFANLPLTEREAMVANRRESGAQAIAPVF